MWSITGTDENMPLCTAERHLFLFFDVFLGFLQCHLLRQLFQLQIKFGQPERQCEDPEDQERDDHKEYQVDRRDDPEQPSEEECDLREYRQQDQKCGKPEPVQRVADPELAFPDI